MFLFFHANAYTHRGTSHTDICMTMYIYMFIYMYTWSSCSHFSPPNSSKFGSSPSISKSLQQQASLGSFLRGQPSRRRSLLGLIFWDVCVLDVCVFSREAPCPANASQLAWHTQSSFWQRSLVFWRGFQLLSASLCLCAMPTSLPLASFSSLQEGCCPSVTHILPLTLNIMRQISTGPSLEELSPASVIQIPSSPIW